MTEPRPRPSSDLVRDLPDRIIVGCTATLHGGGVRRLPDRTDSEGPIAAFLVETAGDARSLFREIDAVRRTVMVDVERKQVVDLVALAQECLRIATVVPHKPNDTTVRSLDVLLTHLLGLDLSLLHIGVIGTGNIGFKSAMLLAERGANVLVHSRDPDNAHRTAEAIRSILPRHSVNDVAPWEGQPVNAIVTAVSARGVVGMEWLDRLLPAGLIIDVGIGNLSTELMGRAIAEGVQILRLDVRTTGNQLVLPSPAFFEGIFGQSKVNGVPVISGGIIGSRGTVVVDSHADPTRIFGIADGVGGLLAQESLSKLELGALTRVKDHLRRHQAKL